MKSIFVRLLHVKRNMSMTWKVRRNIWEVTRGFIRYNMC